MRLKLNDCALGCCLLLAWYGGVAGGAERVDIAPLVGKINAVGANGQGHRDATPAWQKLSTADIEQVPQILAAVDAKNVLASNWIRAAVESIVERQMQSGKPLPQRELEEFLSETKHAPRARRIAYELILRADPAAESRLVLGLLNDPSIELRRDAVTAALEQGDKLLEDGNSKAALDSYRQTLAAARDVDQVKQLTEKLRKLNDRVDLPTHFGFITDWLLIGPFDNRADVGFDAPYPPEGGGDISGNLVGLDNAKLNWFKHQTTDDFGLVDLNKAINKHMGAIAYAYHEFVSDKDQEVDIRIGSTNGNKVWLNGDLVTANHVYHTGRDVDQYIGRARLKAGKNKILVKIAQNEQTEQWAQDWQFQLRICDTIGTAILAKNRSPSKASTVE